jgi:hypothetical protein
MVGAGVLPLITAPVIANMRLHHVLIDGGAGLNVISHAAFKNVVFDVAEVNLPFNAIIGRPALYQFMAIAHYGYLVLKMSSPVRVLTV